LALGFGFGVYSLRGAVNVRKTAGTINVEEQK